MLPVKFTYSLKSGKYNPKKYFDIENVPLNDQLQSLKGSLMATENELRKSLGGINVKEKKSEATRKALADITNLKKSSPVKAKNEEGPSIQSSPLIVKRGKPVFKRSSIKKKTKASVKDQEDKRVEKPQCNSSDAHHLNFTVDPDELGSMIWVKKLR